MYAKTTNKMESIDLGKAGHFATLVKTSIKNNSVSKITDHTGAGSMASSTEKNLMSLIQDAKR